MLNTGSAIRLRLRSVSGLRFGLVRISVKNNRCNGAISVTFRAGTVRFGIKKNEK